MTYKLIDWEFYETRKIDMQDVLDILNSKDKTISIVPQIEETNLYIKSDSSWKEEMKNWVKTITNWKWIWEYSEWELKWEQIFTQQAAKDVAKLQGKTLPSIEQWWQIIQGVNPNIKLDWGWQDDTSIRTALKLKLVGYLSPYGDFNYQGDYGFFWSSTAGRSVGFDKSQVFPSDDNYTEYAFSVRCLNN